MYTVYNFRLANVYIHTVTGKVLVRYPHLMILSQGGRDAPAVAPEHWKSHVLELCKLPGVYYTEEGGK